MLRASQSPLRPLLPAGARSVASGALRRQVRSGPPRRRTRSSRLPALLLPLLLIGCGGTPEKPDPSTPSRDTASSLTRASLALASGRTEEARLAFAPLTSPAQPTSVRGEAFLGLGRIALRTGEPELAARHLDDARALLRRNPLGPTAELLYGDAQMRLGRFQSGTTALLNAFPYLVDDRDRLRAAYLIDQTRRCLDLEPVEPYASLARGKEFPEYTDIFAPYRVDPATIEIARPPSRPRVEAPPPAAAPRTLSLVGRRDWRASPTRKNVVPNRRLTRITIHHTADQGSMVSLGSDDTEGYLRRLQSYFQKTKKYADLPYHFLIAKDGRVFEGRPIQFQGAHAGGRSNQENIGIALIGNFERRAPSERQFAALQLLVDQLSRKHGIAKSRIYPHCDLKETDCPGAILEGRVRSLLALPPAEEGLPVCDHLHPSAPGAVQVD